jgi:trans-aconitate methyltransferase
MICRICIDYAKCRLDIIAQAGYKKYSLVFSNAALQWMDDHEKLLPKLWEIMDDNRAFAAQIPKFEKMPVNIAINNVLEKNKWNKYFHKNITKHNQMERYCFHFNAYS